MQKLANYQLQIVAKDMNILRYLFDGNKKTLANDFFDRKGLPKSHLIWYVYWITFLFSLFFSINYNESTNIEAFIVLLILYLFYITTSVMFRLNLVTVQWWKQN